MVCHDSFSVIEVYQIPILYHRTLLVRGYELQSVFVAGAGFLCILRVELLLRPKLAQVFRVEPFVDNRDVGVVVGVVRIEHIVVLEVGLVHFLKDHVSVFFLKLLFLNDSLRRGDVVV